eukprot:gene13928-biopygen18597
MPAPCSQSMYLTLLHAGRPQANSQPSVDTYRVSQATPGHSGLLRTTSRHSGQLRATEGCSRLLRAAPGRSGLLRSAPGCGCSGLRLLRAAAAPGWLLRATAAPGCGCSGGGWGAAQALRLGRRPGLKGATLTCRTCPRCGPLAQRGGVGTACRRRRPSRCPLQTTTATRRCAPGGGEVCEGPNLATTCGNLPPLWRSAKKCTHLVAYYHILPAYVVLYRYILWHVVSSCVALCARTAKKVAPQLVTSCNAPYFVTTCSAFCVGLGFAAHNVTCCGKYAVVLPSLLGTHHILWHLMVGKKRHTTCHNMWCIFSWCWGGGGGRRFFLVNFAGNGSINRKLPTFAPLSGPQPTRAKWGPMIRMGSGSSLASQRLSREPLRAILSVRLSTRVYVWVVQGGSAPLGTRVPLLVLPLSAALERASTGCCIFLGESCEQDGCRRMGTLQREVILHTYYSHMFYVLHFSLYSQGVASPTSYRRNEARGKATSSKRSEIHTGPEGHIRVLLAQFATCCPLPSVPVKLCMPPRGPARALAPPSGTSRIHNDP